MEIKIATAIKLIGDEYKKHYDALRNTAYKECIPDPQFEMIAKGYSELFGKLYLCDTWDELDEWMSNAGYRMSVQDWLDSYK